MAKGKGVVSTRRLRKLADAREQNVTRSILSSVRSLRAGVDFDALVEAIRVNDVDAAITACDIEDGTYSAVVLELRNMFAEAGQLTMDMMPPIEKGS